MLRNRLKNYVFFGFGAIVCLSGAAEATDIVPSQVLPRDVTPRQGGEFPRYTEPQHYEDQEAIAGADLTFDVGKIILEGAFPGMQSANAAFAARLDGRTVQLKYLFTAARELEEAYARAGYVLARVTVPKQRFMSGSDIRVVVNDGYIERVTLKGLPANVRSIIAKRTKHLEGVRQLTLGQIERGLLMAGDYPGLLVRSAIAKGRERNGIELALSGDFNAFGARFETSNKLPASLGQWQLSGNLTLNDRLGAGEQIYGMFASDSDLVWVGTERAKLGMLGGGAILPLGHGGLKLSGEYLVSRTRPKVAAEGLLSVGHYARGQMRVRVPLVLTRQNALYANLIIDHVTQSLELPDFSTDLSRDRYLAVRLNASWQGQLGTKPFAVDLTYSRGLAGRTPTAELPLSRQGARTKFNRVDVTSRASFPLPKEFGLDFTIRAQHSFKTAQMLPEQFALDADNGVSVFQSGSFNTDSGMTGRAELQFPKVRLWRQTILSPYLFAAVGTGGLANATAVEVSRVRIGGAGAGARLNLGHLPWIGKFDCALAAEYGRQFTNVGARPDLDHFSLRIGLQF